MKKLILIVCFLGFLSNSFAQTNVYHPFPDSNAAWRESYTYLDGTMHLHYFDYQYFIKGDTTVNSKTYHKIYYTGIKTDWPPIDTVFTINELRFGLREDSNKRIWKKIFDSSSESLLYDFNFNNGDFFVSSISPDSANLIIGVDSVLVDNSYRKRYLLHNNWMQSSNPLFIIEGIGASTGLAEMIMPFFESGGRIDCFYQNGQVLWSDSLVTDCGLILNSQIYFGNKTSIELYPNPFSTSTQISFDKTYQTLDLSLIDLQGKIIQQKSYHDCNKINLDRAGIATGFYFLRMSLDGKFVETKKVVVAD